MITLPQFVEALQSSVFPEELPNRSSLEKYWYPAFSDIPLPVLMKALDQFHRDRVRRHRERKYFCVALLKSYCRKSRRNVQASKRSFKRCAKPVKAGLSLAKMSRLAATLFLNGILPVEDYALWVYHQCHINCPSGGEEFSARNYLPEDQFRSVLSRYWKLRHHNQVYLQQVLNGVEAKLTAATKGIYELNARKIS